MSKAATKAGRPALTPLERQGKVLGPSRDRGKARALWRALAGLTPDGVRAGGLESSARR